MQIVLQPEEMFLHCNNNAKEYVVVRGAPDPDPDPDPAGSLVGSDRILVLY